MHDRLLRLRVPKQHGERIRQLLKRFSLVDAEREITRGEMYIEIPLPREPTPDEWIALRDLAPDAAITPDLKIAGKAKRPRSLFQALEGKLDQNLLAYVRHSFDVVGDIALIEVPEELSSWKELIARAIIEVHKGVRTVLCKRGAVDGEFRVRSYEFLLGDHRTETTHREHSCRYMLDVTKVYFSPRLATERLRVASQVGNSETIVDMFAGVGPFSILVAKKSGARVYSIDVNPDAVKYLTINCSLNKVERLVFPILGDARDVVLKDLNGVADRVIMNLPSESQEFVNTACLALKSKGGIIHFYRSKPEPNPIERATKELRDKVEYSGRKLSRVADGRLVRSMAPHEWQVAVDAIIK